MPEPTYRRRTDVLSRVADGVVVLATTSGHNIRLEGPGADLWTLLANGMTAPDLARSLAEVYHADRDLVLRDITPVLEQLLADGYVSSNT